MLEFFPKLSSSTLTMINIASFWIVADTLFKKASFSKSFPFIKVPQEASPKLCEAYPLAVAWLQGCVLANLAGAVFKHRPRGVGRTEFSDDEVTRYEHLKAPDGRLQASEEEVAIIVAALSARSRLSNFDETSSPREHLNDRDERVRMLSGALASEASLSGKSALKQSRTIDLAERNLLTIKAENLKAGRDLDKDDYLHVAGRRLSRIKRSEASVLQPALSQPALLEQGFISEELEKELLEGLS